jgi:endonuclease/exonuclease/phosphatase (EEP) superfamily protein YafD
MRRPLPLVLAIALPWLWFFVRDLGGLFDMVSVGLPLIACAAIVTAALAAVITGRAWPLAAGVSTLAVCAVVILAPMWPRSVAAPDHAIRLVVANVWDANPAIHEVPATLLDRAVDIAVAVEMPDEAFSDEMTADARRMGLRGSVQERTLGAWSRFPLQELGDRGLPRSRVMRVAVDAPDAPFVLYVVHALNPMRSESFDEQRLFTDRLLEAIADEQLPVVVAGDFNMSDRVVSYREMDAALTDAMRADVAGSTTYVGGLWPLLMLRIDHVFVEPTWCASDAATFSVPGSDHRGLQVAVGPCG